MLSLFHDARIDDSSTVAPLNTSRLPSPSWRTLDLPLAQGQRPISTGGPAEVGACGASTRAALTNDGVRHGLMPFLSGQSSMEGGWAGQSRWRVPRLWGGQNSGRWVGAGGGMNPAMAALWHGDDSSKDIATVGAHRQREVVCRLFLFSEADNALYPCLFLPRGLKGSRFVRGRDGGQERRALVLSANESGSGIEAHVVDMNR